MKHYKGFNGRRRKVLRGYKRILALYNTGDAKFDDLWAVFEPMTMLCADIPADDPIHRTMYNAVNIINSLTYEEYRREVVAEYWASVL